MKMIGIYEKYGPKAIKEIFKKELCNRVEEFFTTVKSSNLKSRSEWAAEFYEWVKKQDRK